MKKCQHCPELVEADRYKFCKTCWWEQDSRNEDPSAQKIQKLRADIKKLKLAATRLYKASFEILKENPTEDELGEINQACSDMYEVLEETNES